MRYPLKMMVGGPQSRSGHRTDEEKDRESNAVNSHAANFISLTELSSTETEAAD
jgi:hypothetical protein